MTENHNKKNSRQPDTPLRPVAMDQSPSTSSTFRRPPPSGQLPSTSSSPSQRLPSFRDLNNPIQQVFLNKTKAFNKKTYVPNLFLSRNVQPKVSIENTASTSAKKDSSNRETRRGRREQKLLAPVETFVPGTSSSRNLQSAKSRSKVTAGSTVNVKSESIDRNVIKKVFTKKLPTKFDRISSASSRDLPTAIPNARPASTAGSVEKINPLLTEIMRIDENESPLFILKTPRYIPAVLDDSKIHPKIGAKNDKSGYKCTIHDLPEGQIGKLQILRSGKIRLVLGNCKFWLHRGVKVNFLEELAAVSTNADTRSGDIISLGAIKERIIVIPDILTKLGS